MVYPAGLASTVDLPTMTTTINLPSHHPSSGFF